MAGKLSSILDNIGEFDTDELEALISAATSARDALYNSPDSIMAKIQASDGGHGTDTCIGCGKPIGPDIGGTVLESGDGVCDDCYDKYVQDLGVDTNAINDSHGIYMDALDDFLDARALRQRTGDGPHPNENAILSTILDGVLVGDGPGNNRVVSSGDEKELSVAKDSAQKGIDTLFPPKPGDKKKKKK